MVAKVIKPYVEALLLAHIEYFIVQDAPNCVADNGKWVF